MVSASAESWKILGIFQAKSGEAELDWLQCRIKLESTEEEAAEVGGSHLQKPPSRLQHESLD